ncbi:MAG TPA: ABATE domain-containing protein [Gaiellaceae bacterium]|nr:ABATE domain-containing protein [Gaiellaceae bacterium]
MQKIEDIPHLGGTLCLDFANTVEPRNSAEQLDLFQERDDVLRWASVTGIVVHPGSKPTRRPSQLSAAAAAEELARARALREAVYAAAAAAAREERPDARALATIQGAFAQAMARSELASLDGEYGWRSSAGGVDLVLDAVAKDAVDLLLSPGRLRIKECGDDENGCGWLFVDTTKSGTRRWCSMAVCGTRAKVERHRARQTQPVTI